MRKLFLTASATLAVGLILWGADWPTQSGSPQRDGWARAEKAFTPANAGHIELLYRYAAENKPRGLAALTTPLINGMLITYLGFKEMLVFGGSSDNVFAVDADLNRIIWKTHFEYKGEKPEAEPTTTCPGGLTASLAMPGSASAAPGRGFAGPARGGNGLFATGFGRSGVFLAVSGDGYLHALNTSTGADKVPPVKFLPANSKPGALNVNDGVIYAATSGNCGGNANAVYALDMSGGDPKLSSFPLDGAGADSTAIAADGTVYVRGGALYALTKDLKLKSSFAIPPGGGTAPIVFSSRGKDFVVAGGKDRVYLLEGAALQAGDPVTGGVHGALASWEDTASSTRWVYASSKNTVVAFRLEDRLTPAWTSANIPSTGSMVTANGLVFVLSDGNPPSGHATLHVLDGLTGKELYSFAAATWAHDAGLAVANRRIYFTDHGNTVYCLGFMEDQPQLTGR